VCAHSVMMSCPGRGQPFLRHGCDKALSGRTGLSACLLPGRCCRAQHGTVCTTGGRAQGCHAVLLYVPRKRRLHGPTFYSLNDTADGMTNQMLLHQAVVAHSRVKPLVRLCPCLDVSLLPECRPPLESEIHSQVEPVRHWCCQR